MATLEKGGAFERKVLDILRLLPSAKVQSHVKVGGKDVDALCEFTDLLGGTSVVAFECKDHSRPLTRSSVVEILADYSILLDHRLITKFCLVTTTGIVANALECFDGNRLQHITYSELLSRLLEPRSLVSNMIARFSIDDLDKYYIPARCQNIDLKWVSQNYDIYYNDLIDICLSEKAYNIDLARRLLEKVAADSAQKKRLSQYSSELFEFIILNRLNEQSEELVASVELNLEFRRSGSTAPKERKNDLSTSVENLVVAWANDDAISQSLAILGSYGTGKSSFARRLAHVWARRYEKGETDRIPLLIELRHFGSHQDVEGLITHELMNRHGARHGSYELFKVLNAEGKFLLILDGFDEMKEGMSRDALAFNFNELNRLYSTKSKIVLCGRPTIFVNESEQTNILGGKAEGNLTHSVKYIQIHLRPFSTRETLECLRRYAATKHPSLGGRLEKTISSINKELPLSGALRDLLSRPVHLPMLVAILPGWEGNIKDLRRATLYRMFIDKIISREMLKRRLEFRSVYNIDARRLFAAELAIQMFKLGDSRSIRYSEIPDDLVKIFKRPGQSIESAKRDLIGACFLERKAPDILFFGHKSFAEYLAAERILTSIQEEEYPRTDRFGIKFTPEIFSFLTEIISRSQWLSLFHYPSDNARLLNERLATMVGLLRSEMMGTEMKRKNFKGKGFIDLEDLILEMDTLRIWRTEAARIPENVLYRFVECIELASPRSLNPASEALLRFLLEGRHDLVAVHAYRALVKGGNLHEAALSGIIGDKRYSEWRKQGWLQLEV